MPAMNEIKTQWCCKWYGSSFEQLTNWVSYAILIQCEHPLRAIFYQNILRHSFSFWCFAPGSPVERCFEKRHTLIIHHHPRSAIRAWFGWTSWEHQTTRWHGTLVKLLRGARQHREVILLQAALGSWQQYSLRKLGNKKGLEVKIRETKFKMEHSIVVRKCCWK